MSNVVSFNTCLSGYLQEIFLTARQFRSYLLQIFSLFKKNRKELELKKKTIIRLARNVCCLKTIIRYFFSRQIHTNTAAAFHFAGFGFQNWNAGNETGSANAEISFTFVEKRHHSIFVSSIYALSKKLLITKSRFFFL